MATGVSYLKCTAVLYSEGQLVRIWKPDSDMEKMSFRQASEPKEAGQCDDSGYSVYLVETTLLFIGQTSIS